MTDDMLWADGYKAGKADAEEESRKRLASDTTNPPSYDDFYRNLDGITALATAAATPLKRITKDEKDTAFVKRIVATYLSLAAQAGVHGLGQ